MATFRNLRAWTNPGWYQHVSRRVWVGVMTGTCLWQVEPKVLWFMTCMAAFTFTVDFIEFCEEFLQ